MPGGGAPVGPAGAAPGIIPVTCGAPGTIGARVICSSCASSCCAICGALFSTTVLASFRATADPCTPRINRSTACRMPVTTLCSSGSRSSMLSCKHSSIAFRIECSFDSHKFCGSVRCASVFGFGGGFTRLSADAKALCCGSVSGSCPGPTLNVRSLPNAKNPAPYTAPGTPLCSMTFRLCTGPAKLRYPRHAAPRTERYASRLRKSTRAHARVPIARLVALSTNTRPPYRAPAASGGRTTCSAASSHHALQFARLDATFTKAHA